MARHLVHRPCFAALAAALALYGCGKPPSPSSLERPVHAVAAQAAAAIDPPASPSTAYRGSNASGGLPVASAALERSETEDPPAWLVELLQSPDPNVRIQALDAWARQRGASLNPVTYALVDSDESVRARAQEVFEQALARR